ncbi:hypothetical protein SBC1_42830 (plasmid) [Caballeronia sp. SBC1]|uniref:DUF6402 family protein n=1 Tax=unclassified Caballeronia TaxID=2646786 RepID=UPI0013E17DAE|nr:MULTISPECIES: DUF6402 family protein [unclassified Caballeronia]QIE26440.1 hypothetical protein SBC2_45100 [Caballeronia sp. SBC2]QIN64243.1 hypothetical protein SBC1_42830 [Caballeronia sp. SBC1]
MTLLYYKVHKLLPYVSKEDGARIVREVSLSLDRAPPVRENLKTPSAPAPERLKPQPGDGLIKMMELHSRFKTWMETPDPPKTPKPTKPVEQEKTVPPFDIQEIPGAMRKLHLPVSAALMERWFAGRLNYSPTDDDEAATINQDGKPYPPDMYDTTTVKIDWVLKFTRTKESFDNLINERIRSERAHKMLIERLSPYKETLGDLFPEELCKKDPVMLHRHFHFQFVGVDGTFAQKINLLLTTQWERSGAPDDLTGAIGSFNFYAAIGHARIGWDRASRQKIATVTGVWVYVKDNYTFTDKQGDRSQYLGHWSSNGVIVIPLDAVAATSPYIPYVEYPVTLGNPLVKGDVYYPVYNSDFRKWALKHQRGGDFVTYSDRRYVPVVPPITIPL